MSRMLALLGVLALRGMTVFAQSSDCAGIAAGYVPSLKEETVPRDERRQQILTGIHETRFDYTLAKVPFEMDLFAECYKDGRMTHRLQLTSAMHWNNPTYSKGIFSLGWNHLTHELTLINDNGFGLWNARISVAPEIMTSPYVVVGAEKPQPELRDTVNDYPAQQVTLYPIIALIGEPTGGVRMQSHFELSSTAGILEQAAKINSTQCVIIYMLGNAGGGNPPFTFDEKASFYVHSLPMN